jgi:hypothetical protein
MVPSINERRNRNSYFTILILRIIQNPLNLLKVWTDSSPLALLEIGTCWNFHTQERDCFWINQRSHWGRVSEDYIPNVVAQYTNKDKLFNYWTLTNYRIIIITLCCDISDPFRNTKYEYPIYPLLTPASVNSALLNNSNSNYSHTTLFFTPFYSNFLQRGVKMLLVT